MKFQQTQLKSKKILDEIKRVQFEIDNLMDKRDKLIDEHAKLETGKFMDTHFKL